MESFVSDSRQRAEDAGMRLKHNMPPASPEQKARKHVIWQGKQKLKNAFSLPEKSERVLFSRRLFWLADENGDAVAEMGMLGDDNTIVWNLAALDILRNGA